MNAKTETRSKLLDRQANVAPVRFDSGVSASLSDAAIADVSGNDAVFKKTPIIADLKPTGRDLDKDLNEISNIALLMPMALSLGRSAVRRMSWPVRSTGGIGPNGNFAPEGAVAKVAGMSNLSLSWLSRRTDRADGALGARVDEAAGRAGFGPLATTLDVYLTDADRAARKSKRAVRATDHASGALSKYAQPVGSAVSGPATRPGGAAEKHCYADV